MQPAPGTELDHLRRRIAELEAELDASQGRRRQEDRYLALVMEGMQGLVSYVDRDFRYRFANRRYAEWMGPGGESLQNRTVLDVFGPEVFEQILPFMQRALTGETVHFELTRFYSVGAPPRRVRATYIPDRGPEDEVLGFVVLMEDITEHHRAVQALRSSEERFRRIVESSAEGILIVDLDGHTVFANDRMAELLGYEPQELTGRSGFDFAHPDDRERGLEGFSLRKNGDTRSREYRAIRKDGSVLWLNVTGNVLRDDSGNPYGVVAMCADMSERKAAEEALLRSNRELEEFAYVASHDLQEPLRTINTYTQLLARRLEEHLTPESREYVAFVDGSVKRMVHLIQDLLRFSRVVHESGPVVGVCDLNAALEGALTQLRGHLDGVPHEIRQERLPVVRGDEGQLTQVFQNIVGNAIRYRHPERPLKIGIAARRDDRDWVISVSDNGLGFQPEYAERIFGLFKRLQSDGDGTGLGLAISKRLIERCGGRIWAEGSEGDGATFHLRLTEAATG